MCGIVVLRDLAGRPVSPDTVDRMAGTLRHRGPDDEGRFVEDDVGLGFRRLAILDLTNAGHQPMESPDGQAVIVFNGQIFNYVELRQELRQLGHEFHSTGDTEVLLHAYLQWGPECLSRLNGEWAFMVWDRRTRTLFGARDRFGIKPMYRLATGGYIAWASEIKALLALPGYRPAINWTTAGAYLRDGVMDHTGGTFFQGIESVPAAHAFVVDRSGEERRWRYWALPEPEAGSAPNDPAETFADLFEDAVRIRLRSDVPVGICLSGGLDSTAIICAAERTRRAPGWDGNPISAFLYHHPDFDERRYVEATVAQTQARLHCLEIDHQEIWELAERVVRAHDEPVHTLTALVGYELMGMIARAGIRVVLNGQGADEILAGYSSFFLDSWCTHLSRGHPLRAWRQIRSYTKQHGGSGTRLALSALRRAVQGQFQSATWYRKLAHHYHLRQALRNGWLVGAALPSSDAVAMPIPLQLDQVLRRATTVDPLPLYLRVEDRNSMANSVEVRLPFLDYRLVELAFRVGPEWKIRGPWNKVLLREAMRDRIPEIVRTRPDKMGFPTPSGSLLRGGSFERLFALASSQRARERGVYAWDRMMADLWSHRDRENPVIARQFFRVAQLELWAGVHGL